MKFGEDIKLSPQYREKGFEVSENTDGLVNLLHEEKVIFTIGSALDLQNGFIDRLCEVYLQFYQKK